MAKDELKQMKYDYTNLQKAKKITDNENVRLKGVDGELVKAKGTINAEQAKLVISQKQYSDLLKKTQGLEKTVKGYEDPKALKDELSEKQKQIASLESKVQDLQKRADALQKEKQEMIAKDDLSSEAMQQVQEKDKENKKLDNELVSVKKKMAKYEGDFRFPSGGTPMLSVPMGDGKVAEAQMYSPKQPAGAPSMIVTAITQDGKAVSVDFKKA